MHDPPLLVLDEPTAGVDVELRMELHDYIRHLHASGRTILLTTHYLEEAEALCDDLALIQHGRVAMRGTPRDLKGEHGAEHGRGPVPAGRGLRAGRRTEAGHVTSAGTTAPTAVATTTPAQAHDTTTRTGFLTLLERELLRVLKIWTQTIAAPVLTGMLYFAVFGVAVGERIGSIGGHRLRHLHRAGRRAHADRDAELQQQLGIDLPGAVGRLHRGRARRARARVAGRRSRS